MIRWAGGHYLGTIAAAQPVSFSQPRGREQIKLSKKAAKAIGKKVLELEELQPGSKVSLQYYPGLGQLMELIIEKPTG